MDHTSSEGIPSTKSEYKINAHDDGLHPEVSHAHGSSADLEVKPKVHFNIWACLGVNFSITATPIAIGTMLALAIGVGGPPFFFYEYLFAGIGQLVLCVAMAEVASAIPHSTGPAYWVQVLGPKKLARPLHYIMGWSTNACWFFITAACYLFAAQLFMATIQVGVPDFEPRSWQVYLVYCAMVLQGWAINLPRTYKIVGWSLKAAVFFINGTAVFILVALLVKTNPKQSARTVFVDVVNETGWSSNVVVFFISILPGVASVGGIDSAPHLTDEVDEPRRQIPLVMMGSAALSFFVGLPSILIYLFCIPSLDNLRAPVGGQPIIQLMMDSFDNTGMTMFAGIACVLINMPAGWASFLSWNRLYWSFSRDDGFPLSGWTKKLSKLDSIPVNAMYVNVTLLCGIGAISIGSSIAINALLGGASLCGKGCWTLVFIFIFWRGRDKALDKRRWLNLGRVGNVVDGVALVWSTWVCVWLSFPLYLPVSASTMNYASAVFGGVVCIAVTYYFAVYKHQKHEVHFDNLDDVAAESVRN